MQFRKINYITLIYHFFTFNYTLGMFTNFNNEKYFRKAKMNVFFPLFTSLNNLEGRPLHLKKRPFALFYYSLFCRENLRESFLPFNYRNNTGLFTILFRYAMKNNFFFKKRIEKKKRTNFLFVKNNKNLFFKLSVILLFFKFFTVFKKRFLIIKMQSPFFISFIKFNNTKTFNKNSTSERINSLLSFREKIVGNQQKIRISNKKLIKYELVRNSVKYLKLKNQYFAAKKIENKC